MPQMDGLTTLKEIMKKNPLPVIIISSLTTEGAKTTLDALELGAVDFIPKQLSHVSLEIVKIRDDLIHKVKTIFSKKNILIARYTLGRNTRRDTQPTRCISSAELEKRVAKIRVVAIGSSTGGPPALQEVFSKFPEGFPCGVLVVQHMPPLFIKSLAERLDGMSRLKVREAQAGDLVRPGEALIAPGDKHMILKRCANNSEVVLTDDPSDSLYKPSVGVMMSSVADIYGSGTLGVILTGMGNDGLEGIRKIKAKGGLAIAQNEETCVVYGMPRAIVEEGLADRVSPLGNVADDIMDLVRINRVAAPYVAADRREGQA
jgi:two-component system chemotaxis response regulator CheB